jgi:hypothetical protein
VSFPVKPERFYGIASALQFVTASSSVSNNGSKILRTSDTQ